MSGATRRSRNERRQAVLGAAAERVRAAQIDWAAALTFGALAQQTGIDQGQIARDFGSKEGLAVELARYLLDPEAYRRQAERSADRTAALVDREVSVADAVRDWAAGNDLEYRGRHEQLRSQMMLWAAAEPGSAEWEQLGRVARAAVDRRVEATDLVIDRAVANGATRRRQLSAQELVVVLGAVVEGLAIRASVAPELVADDLTARTALALIAALVGPDEIGPAEQLERLRLGPIDDGTPR